LCPARGTTMLHVACGYNLVDIAMTLLQQGADVEEEDEEGNRPLHFAAKNGHVKIVRALLDAGAEMEARNRGD